MQLGLALSGGGFRATFFHLGVVSYLRDRDLLRNIRCITSVSGGSVLGAHLVLNWPKYVGSDANFADVVGQLIALARADVRGRVARRWLASVGGRSPSTMLAGEYDRHLFRGATLGDLRQDEAAPDIHILATNLTRHCPASFSGDGFRPDGQSSEGCIPSTSFSVARAVMVSSSFPAFFPPVGISSEELGARVKEFVPTLQYFTDGGVFDNSGLAMLRQLAEEKAIDGLIASDAGREIDWDDRQYGLLDGLSRTFDILMERVGAFESGATDDLPVYPLRIGGAVDTEQEWPVEVQRLTSTIRTDLDLFSDVEIGSLIRHGYNIAGHGLEKIVATSGRAAYRSGIDVAGGFWSGGKRRVETLREGQRIRPRLISLRDPLLLVPLLMVLVLVVWAGVSGGRSLFEKSIWRGGPSLNLEKVASLVVGPGEDRERLLFRRGFFNNVLSMAFEPLPITGDRQSTRAARIQSHTTVFVQGRDRMIKLQRFDLPGGARQIRAQSRQTVGATGDLATVWIFLETDSGTFVPLRLPLSGHWQIDTARTYRSLYTLALYEAGLFSQVAEFSGAEIDDLAGKVGEVKFVVGGDVRDVRFGDVFQFANQSPLNFHERSQSDTRTLDDPWRVTSETFSGVVGSARRMRNDEGYERLSEVLGIWDEFVAIRHGSWAGFSMVDVMEDFIVGIDGRRGLSAQQVSSK